MNQIRRPTTIENMGVDLLLCPVEVAARIIGRKWTLQIVHTLLDTDSMRFCELQEALGGVNPSTLSSRLKMLEEEGMVYRIQISDIPPHVEYSLTQMGHELEEVIAEVSHWSRAWLCPAAELAMVSQGGQPAVEDAPHHAEVQPA